jgi:hypothetical protein
MGVLTDILFSDGDPQNFLCELPAGHYVGALKDIYDAGPTVSMGEVAELNTWDEVIEGSMTARQLMRVMMAVLANKSDGGGTATIHMRDVADGKNRVTATVDASGNRTTVVVDGS